MWGVRAEVGGGLPPQPSLAHATDHHRATDMGLETSALHGILLKLNTLVFSTDCVFCLHCILIEKQLKEPGLFCFLFTELTFLSFLSFTTLFH